MSRYEWGCRVVATFWRASDLSAVCLKVWQRRKAFKISISPPNSNSRCCVVSLGNTTVIITNRPPPCTQVWLEQRYFKVKDLWALAEMTNALDSSLVVFLKVLSRFLATFLKICGNLNCRCGAVLIQLCVKNSLFTVSFLCVCSEAATALNPAVTWISWEHYYHICNFWQLFRGFHHFEILWFFFLKSPNLTTSGTK